MSDLTEEDFIKARKVLEGATRQVNAKDYRSLLIRLETYEKALSNLANEAQGFHSLANVADHGHTNMQCLALRIKEARAALGEKNEVTENE